MSQIETIMKRWAERESAFSKERSWLHKRRHLTINLANAFSFLGYLKTNEATRTCKSTLKISKNRK